mmetsp:Transcript_55951/g.118976  ORF Transcript_55951/g.118976 Transcript_55951/m.118976 type:complete len:166 (+) Transcript_55951:76-573(+)|eukprot:CAMPEP_0172555038 /NCGR_PEP_ID=MMETSP1067-20121228/57690_1 /TAXON_ID=265564 ORGANISM="Thalassiosira punctigera, Strain Tpunct2005C2" /NCGR_SAMPLE_ID=MMETSP1067 /ASSEMBLY_ACC=CAM_ASM_000444 /LENGTH=165 /DNA_ID=CAMNT_0013343537 /DNA_START=64 /DNA_END=561 /DNA_ORIENTATION=-
MSVIEVLACSVLKAPHEKRVRFRSMCEVREVTHEYPSNYFYTPADYYEFRKEAREEKMGSVASPVQKVFDVASLSMIAVALLMVGLVAATIACLPMLLLLKSSSLIFSCTTDEYIDSSVQPYSTPIDPEASPLVERLVLGLMTQCSLFWSDSRASQREAQCVSPR